MLDIIRNFFNKAEAADAPSPDALPVAAGALMVEAALADEVYTDKERKIIGSLLQSAFDLSAEDAAKIRLKAEAHQADANDLHQFTRPVKSLPAETKILLIEGLWRIVLSDAARDPFEEALIRRVAGLLYVSDVESGLARQRAQAALAG